ncbi:MAG: hypothetical protein JJT81_04465 [Rubellimicrobium sp.]|nr:hypothetical protein [Rubellimicrobium sp.]
MNFRQVRVDTASVLPTVFMRFVGINQLNVTPVSAAEERYSKVEVALILDLSNSMNWFNRIGNLRIAGQDFIDTLFENAEPGQVSVSIIPYTGQVNLGPELASFFNITPSVPQSHCVDFHPSVYNTMSITPGATLVGTGHFDPWFTSEAPQMFFCPIHTGNRSEIVTMSGDRNFLRNRVGNLMADGNTSIEIGVKWGAALLDPAMRPVISSMISNGTVDSAFAGRPLNYDDPDVLKVMVIMTDGENFEQWMMHPDYKTGPSTIWRNPSDNRISIFHAGQAAPNRWFVPHNNTWQNRPWGAPSTSNFGTVQQMTWDQVWNRHTVRWVARNLYGNPLGSTNAQRNTITSNWINTWLSRRAAADKNEHLRAICDTVKERGIPIFTVAFEAPSVGVASMQMCATSQSHFFDVQGTDIRRAFRAIAGTINRLRLVQ